MFIRQLQNKIKMPKKLRRKIWATLEKWKALEDIVQATSDIYAPISRIELWSVS